MRDFLRLVLWLLLSLLLGLSLQKIYFVLSAPPAYPWISIALIHTVMSLVILFWQRQRYRRESRESKPLWIFGPAFCIVLGAVSLSLLTRSPESSAANPFAGDLSLWPSLGLVAWVPMVEEVVFRFGLGHYLRSKAGLFLGIYLSSLTFALAHGGGESTLWALVLPPLGPFLLAFLADLIYWRSKSIWGAVFFHSACNATPFIFLAIDPRWLEWLKLLYLQA